MMRFIIMLFGLGMTLAFAAEVYMNQDSHGNVVYSDRPVNSDSKLITPPTVNTVSGTSSQTTTAVVTTTNETTPIAEQGNQPYTKFSIASPANGETIQNQPNITVVLSIVPPLQKGDYIQVYLDGSPWDKPQASTTFSLVAPDRGTHTVSAKLFNKDNRLLMSAPANTIYVHHAALGGNAIQRP